MLLAGMPASLTVVRQLRRPEMTPNFSCSGRSVGGTAADMRR